MRSILALLLVTAILQNTESQSDVVGLSVNTTTYVRNHRCVWSPCNVPGFSSPYFNYTLDCCTLQVPLNYAKPDRNISIAMSRLTPSRPTGKNNTLFALAGGPGGSGWGLLGIIVKLIPATSGITIILPDHRGTGWSTALGCDDNMTQNVTTDCVSYLISKWGVDGLNQFSVTAAAHDLSVQVQAYQADNPGRVAVYGVSYGTFWLDRFLQIYPALVQSAIMDGILSPIMSSISRYELWASSVGSQFLSFCLSEPQCSRYFPAKQPPHIMLYNILNEIDSNSHRCINDHFTKYRISADTIRNLFFGLINGAELYMDRTVIPAVIYRLNRCNAEDVPVLDFFFRASLEVALPDQEILIPPGFAYVSFALQQNIVQSEEWLGMNEPELDRETLTAWHQSTIIAPDLYSVIMSVRSQWPKYPIDQYRYKVASYSPLLMISGQLDPATPFEHMPHLASITAKTRTLYGIPLVGHFAIHVAEAGFLCPLHLVCSWAFPDLFPEEWGDPKCVGDMPTTIDFVGATELGQKFSMKLLNISRPFGNRSDDRIPHSDTHRVEPSRLTNRIIFVAYFLLVTLFI